jgi:hypothetical protein
MTPKANTDKWTLKRPSSTHREFMSGWPRFMFFVAGFVTLVVTYRASHSSSVQGVVLIAYLGLAAVLKLAQKAHHVPVRTLDGTEGRGRVAFATTIVVWGAVVAVVIAPAIESDVGVWAVWWLVLPPAVEVQRCAARRVCC